MKKRFLILAVFVMIFTGTAFAQDLRIGSCIYRFSDAFMLRFRNAMSIEALKNSQENAIELEIVDSQNDQTTQNEQIDKHKHFTCAENRALICNKCNYLRAVE